MKTVIKNLSNDEIKRIFFLKKEFKIKILKSLRKNSQSCNINRFYSQYLIQKNHFFYSKQINFCKKTGKAGGVWKFSNYSRHTINKMCQYGAITNIRTHNEK